MALQIYLKLTLASFINLENVRLSLEILLCQQLQYNTNGALVGTLCAIVFLLFSLSIPLYFIRLLWVQRNQVKSIAFKLKYATLTDRFSLRSFSSMLGNIFYMLKLLFTVIILVQLRNFPGLQIPLLVIISILNQIYIVKVWPFEEPRENYLALLNEWLVSLYLYDNILLSDFNTSGKWRQEAGMALIWILIGSIFVNMLEMFIRCVKGLYPKIQAKLCR